MSAPPQLTLEQAKALTNEAIAVFEHEENKNRLTQAVIDSKSVPWGFGRYRTLIIAAGGGDPGKKMQLVLPIVQELAGPVISKYGFMPAGWSNATEGVSLFNTSLKL